MAAANGRPCQAWLQLKEVPTFSEVVAAQSASPGRTACLRAWSRNQRAVPTSALSLRLSAAATPAAAMVVAAAAAAAAVMAAASLVT